jgi:hypothetical protein
MDELVLMAQRGIDWWDDPGRFAAWAAERYGLDLPGEYKVEVEPKLPLEVRSLLIDPDSPEHGWRALR